MRHWLVLSLAFSFLPSSRQESTWPGAGTTGGEHRGPGAVARADREPPTKPADLRCLQVTSRAVRLSWAASRDDRGVARYVVFRDGERVGAPEEAGFRDRGLRPGATHVYAVAAVDAAGNSSPSSAPLLVTTLAAGDGVPRFAPGVDLGLDAGIGAVPAFENVTSTVAADLDGDGRDDLAVFEGGRHAGGPSARILAWLEAPDPRSGNARWTRHDFDPRYPPRHGRDFYGSAAAGDVDGDGDLDVVYAEDRHSDGTYEGFDARIVWLENPRLRPPPGSGAVEGPWRFRTVARFAHAAGDPEGVEHVNDLALADLDGDGRLDVVVRHLNGPDSRVKILFQDPPAPHASTPRWSVLTLGEPWTTPGEGLALGDVDRDSRPDIALSGSWLRAPAGRDARAAASYSRHDVDPAFFAAGNGAVKCAVGDLDQDGLTDLAFATAEGAVVPGATKISVYLGPPRPESGAWRETVLAADTSDAHNMRLADLDADGRLDVLTGFAFGRDGIRIYRQPAPAVFGPRYVAVSEHHGLYSGVCGDFDGDGDLDVAGPRDYRSNLMLFENLLVP